MTIMPAMATVTFSVRNVTGNNRSHFHSDTKSTFVDVLSLVFQPCAIFHEKQESPSESRIHFESPSESAQELYSTVDVTLVIALVSSTFPATDSFPAISLTVLGNSKRAGILRERCVPGEVWEGFTQTGKRSISLYTSE